MKIARVSAVIIFSKLKFHNLKFVRKIMDDVFLFSFSGGEKAPPSNPSLKRFYVIIINVNFSLFFQRRACQISSEDFVYVSVRDEANECQSALG